MTSSTQHNFNECITPTTIVDNGRLLLENTCDFTFSQTDMNLLLKKNKIKHSLQESKAVSKQENATDSIPTDRDVGFNSPKSNYPRGNTLLKDLLTFHRLLRYQSSDIIAEAILKSFSFDYYSDHDVESSFDLSSCNGKYYKWNEGSWEILGLEAVREIIVTIVTNDNVNGFALEQTDGCIENMSAKHKGIIRDIIKTRKESTLGMIAKDESLKVGDYDVIVEDGYFNVVFDQLVQSKHASSSSLDRVTTALDIVIELKVDNKGRFLAKRSDQWYELGYLPAVEYTIKKLWKASNEKVMKEAANIMTIMNDKSTGIENIKSNTTNILAARIDENDKSNETNTFESDLKELRIKVLSDNLKSENKKQKFQRRLSSGNNLEDKNETKKQMFQRRFSHESFDQSSERVIPEKSESKKEKFKRRYSHESAASEDESKKQKFRRRYSHDSQNHESASESKKQKFQRRFSHDSQTFESQHQGDELAALEQIRKNDQKRLDQLMNRKKEVVETVDVGKQQQQQLTMQAFLNDNSKLNFAKLKDQFLSQFQKIAPNSLQMLVPTNDNLALSLKMAELKRRNSLEIAARTALQSTSITAKTSLNLATASALAAVQARRSSEVSIDASQLAAVVAARSVAAQQVRRYSQTTAARRNSGLEAIRNIEMERRMSMEGVKKRRRSSVTFSNDVDQQQKRNRMKRGSIELFRQASTNSLAQQIASVKSELEALVSSDSDDEKD